MTTTLDLTFPLADIGSEILVTVPFSFDFPTGTRKRRDATERSFSSISASQSSTLYKTIEKYIGQVTGADGHACLLRAMCEASSTPLHDEGILGDAVNFLLTANYASEETDDKFKKYLDAQSRGQVILQYFLYKSSFIHQFQLHGECSSLNAECPISFFRFIADNLV